MWRLLLYFTILQIVHCKCPTNLYLTRDGQCRGRYSYGYPTMDTAVETIISSCNGINAVPYSIHDDEQLTWWSSWTPSSKGCINVMGLMCNSNSKKWEWADGTAFDFKPPSGTYDKELDEDCKPCSWMLSMDGYWSVDCSHSSMNIDYYCTYQLTPPLSSTNCGNFDDDSDDSIAKIAENWNDAQNICHSFGSEIASVHSAQENSYIRRLAVSNGATNGVLLGGKISGKGNDFGWIDGSDWDYGNFYPGFPIDGFGECLTMDTLTTAGQWMNTDCNSKLPVVCSRPLDTSPETVCSSAAWKEGQIIYSPGFPNNASVPCDYFLTVPAGKLVKLEILLLEANSCCDHLLLTDGYVGGTIIANLTGEISGTYYYTSTSNIMRVSWQPNGGINVRGVMMTFWTK